MPYINADYWVTGYTLDDIPKGISAEPLQVVEIVQPLCSRVFGTSPCLATGTKCYNTDKTCAYLPALDMTSSLSLRFVANTANRIVFGANAFQPSDAIPSLLSVSTAPTVLNIGAGNENISPLGQRAVASVRLRDHPYNDYQVDPYRTGRGYDPATKGSFWSKWLARNPFYVGTILRIYDGFMGDALSDMIMREYSIEKIDRTADEVQITAKDILRVVTDNNPMAPALSTGVLAANITAAATSLTVSGANLTDYPATGWVRIGSEVIAYTSRATSGSNILFSGLTRGQLNTTAAAANQFDTVQRVLSYVAQTPSDIVYDLLTTWGKIPTGYITKANWDAETAEHLAGYSFTAYLTEPTPVQQAVGEICQQAMANVWWDERVQKIIWRALRPSENAIVLTDADNIISRSFVQNDSPDQRASQVYFYYGLRSPVLSIGDRASYRAAEYAIDVDSERQYGESKVKEIFARWVTSSLTANEIAVKYLQRYRNTRSEITFELSAADIGSAWVGDSIVVKHFGLTDENGDTIQTQWIITSAETVVQGLRYRFTAEDNGSAGVLWKWVDDANMGASTLIGCWTDSAGTDGAGNEIVFGWL